MTGSNRIRRCGVRAFVAAAAPSIAAGAFGAGSFEHGCAPARARLNFGDPACLVVYDPQSSATPLGADPEPGVEPVDPARGTLRLRVHGPSDAPEISALTYQFPPDGAMVEVHLGFRVFIEHPAALDGVGELGLLDLRRGDGTVLLRLYQDAGGTALRLGDRRALPEAMPEHATPLPGRLLDADRTYPLDQAIPPRAPRRVRIRYRAADWGQENGIVEVRIDDDLVLSIPDHDLADPVAAIALCCAAFPPLSAHAADKEVHFSRLAWGEQPDDALWTDAGLQLGAAHSDSDPAAVDVRLRYQLEPGAHGAVAGEVLCLQYQFRRTGEVWSDAGPPVPVGPDDEGEYIDYATIAGLEPDVEHEFRVLVQDGAAIDLASNVCRLTLPSADTGPPTSFDFVFGSCATAQLGIRSVTPQRTFLTMLDHAPRMFFHLGDIVYADRALQPIVPVATTEAAFRQHLRVQLLETWEQHELYTRCATIMLRDNHDRAGVRFGAGALALTTPPDIGVRSTAAARRYTSGRRLRTLPADVSAGSLGEGSDGTWFKTSRCLFILTDGLCARNGDEGDRTFWGRTQLEEVKTLLRENDKPLVFLLNGVLVGGVSAGAVGVVAQFPEWAEERDAVIQEFIDHNPEDRQLFILTGDRHEVLVWDWHPALRVRPEWSVSPLGKQALAPSEVPQPIYAGWGPYELLEQRAFLYGQVHVDETRLEVTIAARDGQTGAVVFEQTYTTADLTCCVEDVNCSGDVGFGDILALLARWGPCDECSEDLDGNGEVGLEDALIVIGAWGACVP